MNTPTPRTDALYFQRGNWANEEELRDLARRLETELAEERSRLDWLESDEGVDWQWNDAGGGIVSRAKIDAAKKGPFGKSTEENKSEKSHK